MALGKAITEHERVAIAAGYASGMTPGDLAIKYERSPTTIWRIVKRLKGSPAAPSVEDYRKSLKDESIQALHRSLRDKKQIHRAAQTALGVMKGIGEFAGDVQSGVTISFEPGALEWWAARRIGSGSTPAAQLAEASIESSGTTSSGTGE